VIALTETAATIRNSSDTGARFQMTAFPVERVVVGTRHRRDLGDIAGLAASMSEIGGAPPDSERFRSGPRTLRLLCPECSTSIDH
jgi:hypothetical protein